MEEKDKARIKRNTAKNNFAEKILVKITNPVKKIRFIDKVMDVVYDPSGVRTKMDYLFNSMEEKQPIFIYIHGGGFLSGLREARVSYCAEWVEKGFFALNLGYDYDEACCFPKYVHQCFKAIEFFLDNCCKYDVDAEKVVISGDSAGAYLAGYIGAICTHPHLFDELGINFKYRESFKISACVLNCGMYNVVTTAKCGFPGIENILTAFTGLPSAKHNEFLNSEECWRASTINFADNSFPPSFLISSKTDKLRLESVDFEKKLKENGVNCEAYLCKGAISSIHGGALVSDTKDGKICLETAFRFVKSVLEGKNDDI